MSDPDINELAQKQAVLEERVESSRKENASGYERLVTMHASGYDRLVTMMEASEAKRDEQFKAMDAKLDAGIARMEASAARMDATVAKMQTRIILWVVAWVTALFAMGFTALRYLPDPPPTAAAPPAEVVDQAAPAVSQR